MMWQVYIAVHPKFGTKAFFPHNGLRKGNQGSHEGVKLWTAEITEAQREFIKAQAYYNQKAALTKLKLRPQARQDEFRNGAFDAKNFLVCTLALQLSCAQQALHALAHLSVHSTQPVSSALLCI